MDTVVYHVGGVEYQRDGGERQANFYWRGAGWYVVPDWSECEFADRMYVLSTRRKAQKLQRLWAGGARARRRNYG